MKLANKGSMKSYRTRNKDPKSSIKLWLAKIQMKLKNLMTRLRKNRSKQSMMLIIWNTIMINQLVYC